MKHYYENSAEMTAAEIDEVALSLELDENAIKDMFKEFQKIYFDIPEAKFRASGDPEDLRIMNTWGHVLKLFVRAYTEALVLKKFTDKMKDTVRNPEEVN